MAKKPRKKKPTSVELPLFQSPPESAYALNEQGQLEGQPTAEEEAMLEKMLREADEITGDEYEQLRAMGIEKNFQALDDLPPAEIKRMLRSNAGVAALKERIRVAKPSTSLQGIDEVFAEGRAITAEEAMKTIPQKPQKAPGKKKVRPTAGNLFPGEYRDIAPSASLSPGLPSPPSVKGQGSFDRLYEEVGEGNLFPGQYKDIPKAGIEGPGPELVSPRGQGSFEGAYEAAAAKRALPKTRWQKAGLMGKGLLKGAGRIGKAGLWAGVGLGAAVGVADLLKEPAKGLYDYVTKDPVEEQGRMLRARENLIRLRQKQEANKRETERLRAVNMAKLGQINPQLAMELSVGRVLPKGATVLGGRPQTDALEAIADAMAEGTLDPNMPGGM
jgi:hypothetical protein